RPSSRWSVQPPGSSTCSCFPSLLRAGGLARGGQPAGLAQRIAQHIFNLRIEAAQLVVRPPLHCRQDLGIDAQRIALLLRHPRPFPRRRRRTSNSTTRPSPLTASATASTTASVRDGSPPAQASPPAPARI